MKKTVKYRKQLEMGGFQTVNHAKNREVSQFNENKIAKLFLLFFLKNGSTSRVCREGVLLPFKSV